MVSVLYVTSLDPESPGGIQTLIRNQVRGLEELGHNVETLVIPSSPNRSFVDFIPRRRYIRTQDNFPPKEWLRYAYYNHQEQLVRSAIKQFDFDIVHAGMIKCAPALYLAEKEGIPSVVSTHALELRNNRLAQMALGSATASHCVSQYTKGLVEAIRPSTTTRVIPPSIDVLSFRQETESPNYKNDVITMGRFVDRKNIRTVIEAWKRLDSNIIDGRTLHVVGNGPKRSELEQCASGCDNIRFTGYISEREKREALVASDLFVLTPKKDGFDVEGFGIVWIEAQAAGTPVIGSSFGGAPESIGDCGVTINRASDVEAVEKAIQSTLSSPTKTPQQIRERVMKFGILPVAKKLEELYHDLID